MKTLLDQNFPCGFVINASRGPSSHPGPGGNWPSTTPNSSGGGRGNAR